MVAYIKHYYYLFAHWLSWVLNPTGVAERVAQSVRSHQRMSRVLYSRMRREGYTFIPTPCMLEVPAELLEETSWVAVREMMCACETHIKYRESMRQATLPDNDSISASIEKGVREINKARSRR